MAEIILVKQDPIVLPEADKEAARRVLFGIVDGLGQHGKKQWRRFINGLMRLEPGEMVEIKTHKQRSGPFHRRHMKLEQVFYEAQERFELFDPFRDWLKVGAGHVDWYPGPKGAIFPVPRSIAYDKLEEDEMREFHENTIKFLRTGHAAKTLWKHLSTTARIDMVESILRDFGE